MRNKREASKPPSFPRKPLSMHIAWMNSGLRHETGLPEGSVLARRRCSVRSLLNDLGDPARMEIPVLLEFLLLPLTLFPSYTAAPEDGVCVGRVTFCLSKVPTSLWLLLCRSCGQYGDESPARAVPREKLQECQPEPAVVSVALGGPPCLRLTLAFQALHGLPGILPFSFSFKYIF